MTDLQEAWQAFIDVAVKHWPDYSDALVRVLPALKAISTEIHGIDPAVIYEDGTEFDMQNGITPGMWVRKE